MQLTEKIYGYFWQGQGNNCNSYLFAGEKLVLIDPGHIRNEFRENCLEMLKQGLSNDGFALEDIEMVLLTHGHPDHSEAAAAIKEQNQTPVALHGDEEEHMIMLARLFEQMAGKKPAHPEVDIYLQEGDLELGDSDVAQVISTPGHSPGSVSFYFPAEKALVTGDAVFSGSIGRTDFPGGSMRTLGQSIRKLSELDDVEWLLPGHMQAVKGKEQVKRNFSLIERMFFV